MFLLAGNPLLCDCSLQWTLGTDSLVADLRELTCSHHDQSAAALVSPLVSASQAQFLCHYEVHCFSLCKCCGFLACDCRMDCPDLCTCLHDEVRN